MITEILKTIVLGIIQGITEWLPISSTGHMILANQFIRLDYTKNFVDLFMVVIQFGSILAVIILYFHKLNPFSRRKSKAERTDTWNMWFKVLVAVIPAAIIGLKFDDAISAHFYNAYVVSATLIIYGVLFIIIEKRKRKASITSISGISYKTAFIIGIFQMLALIPGTSRSGATILGAILIGTSRETAAEFSFFLAVPVMFGASMLKIIKYFLNYGCFTGNEAIILFIGMAVAYAVSLFAIKFLMGYIKDHDFKAFGYYRIILGILVIAYFAITGAAVIA